MFQSFKNRAVANFLTQVKCYLYSGDIFYLQIPPYSQPKWPFLIALLCLGNNKHHHETRNCLRPSTRTGHATSACFSYTGDLRLEMPNAAVYPPSPVKPRLHASGRGPENTACRGAARISSTHRSLFQRNTKAERLDCSPQRRLRAGGGERDRPLVWSFLRCWERGSKRTGAS